MKPMTLTIHPPVNETMRRYLEVCEAKGWEPERLPPGVAASKAKRFSDSELAAEHWRARWNKLEADRHQAFLTSGQQRVYDTMIRFITTPNYDEGEP